MRSYGYDHSALLVLGYWNIYFVRYNSLFSGVIEMTVFLWFVWRRWQFMAHINSIQGYQPKREENTLHALHNNNVAGCRKHPVIYNDMCRIVRGMK